MADAANDLVILVADKNIEEGMRGLLSRPPALGIHPIRYEIIRHPHRDSGCCRDPHTLLRSFLSSHRHALVMFDREGCGSSASRERIEAMVEERLAQNGWKGRHAAIVLDPEVEVWVWSGSPALDEMLMWRSPMPPLRGWLCEQGYLREGERKPARPKEALEAALRQARLPRSSSLYRQLAERVSLQGHAEPAFLKLRSTLRAWFPPQE